MQSFCFVSFVDGSLESLAKPAVTLSDLVSSSLPFTDDDDALSTAESFFALLMPSEAEWEENMDVSNQVRHGGGA